MNPARMARRYTKNTMKMVSLRLLAPIALFALASAQLAVGGLAALADDKSRAVDGPGMIDPAGGDAPPAAGDTSSIPSPADVPGSLGASQARPADKSADKKEETDETGTHKSWWHKKSKT